MWLQFKRDLKCSPRSRSLINRNLFVYPQSLFSRIHRKAYSPLILNQSFKHAPDKPNERLKLPIKLSAKDTFWKIKPKPIPKGLLQAPLIWKAVELEDTKARLAWSTDLMRITITKTQWGAWRSFDTLKRSNLCILPQHARRNKECRQIP